MGRVEGKVAIITGAASGLGEAEARLLAAEGAQVILTDIDTTNGERIAAEINARFIKQDVSDEATWEPLVTGVVKEFGQLDIMVNNAGVGIIANIETTTSEIWRKTLGIHLDGTFWGCQQAIRVMKDSGGGSIINTASTTALTGAATYLAYSAAKGAIRSMSKSIALHCKAQGYKIRCNSIHPGLINTPLAQHAMINLAGADFSKDEEAVRLQFGMGEPMDVAYLVLYLGSDESKHVNGTELVIDNCDSLGG